MEAIVILPKSVNICGVPYEIELCSDPFDIDAHFGQIEYKNSKIKICSDTTEPMMMQTLCHEIVHGMLVHLGFQEMSNDEQFVQSLGMAINQTFDVKGSG